MSPEQIAAMIDKRMNEMAAALDAAGFKADRTTVASLMGLFLRVMLPMVGVDETANELRKIANDLSPATAPKDDNRIAEVFAKFTPKVVH